MRINIDADSIALAEDIRLIQLRTNALDGWHARQDAGTYGPLGEALLRALMCGQVGDKDAVGDEQWEAALAVAKDIHRVLLDSGESVQYAIDYLNEQWDIEYACDACGAPHDGYCDSRVEEHRNYIVTDGPEKPEAR